MIIDVKATKAKGEERSPSPYAFTEEKPSRGPVVLSLLLTGMALYLKSVFPGWGQPTTYSRPEPEPEESKAAPKLVLIPSDNILGLAVDSQPVGGTPSASADVFAVSGGRLVDLQPPASFMVIEPPEVDLFEIPVPEVALPKLLMPQAGLRSANDNRGPGSSAGSGGDDMSDGAEDPDDDGFDPGGDLDPGHGDDTDPDDNDIDPDDNTDPDDDDDDEDDDDEDDDNDGTGNRAPRVAGPVYLHDVFGCMAAVIGLGELLRNASDPDGDALSIANLTVSSGTLTQTANGWTFSGGMLGPITLTYEITDGTLSIVQHAYFNVLKNPAVIGTPGSDVLVGTECADDIDGGGCDDNIDGRGGHDTIEGGAGNDHIVAGSGNDLVRGGDGNDIVFGGPGMDWISGGKGDDRLFGGDGDDVIFGDDGNDFLHGEEGDDLLFGGAGDDLVLGGAGRDVLDGGEGEDTLSGGGGDDALFGAAGSDVLEGGDGNDLLSGQDGEDRVLAEAGDDTIVGDADGADDSYDGGCGTDTLDYSAAQCAIDVDLAEGTAASAEIGTDAVTGVEIVLTGQGDDTITGSDGSERLSAGAGDDVIADGGGCDAVDAGVGDDTVVAALDGAADNYEGGKGTDTLDYSAAICAVDIDLAEATAAGAEIGTDTVAGMEIILTGQGADTIAGSNGSERLNAGAGDDVITDGGGCDAVDAGVGDDTVVASPDAARDDYEGGEGADTLDYSATMSGVLIDLKEKTATGIEIGTDTISGFEAIVGGAGDDHFVVTGAAVSLQGGEGSDLFEFEAVTGTNAGAQVVHDILDFMVGDRIMISKYEIFKEVMDSLEDRFEDIYGDEVAKDDLPIRIRHEQTDNIRQTLIDVDFDQDQTYEMTINISGDHVLMVVDNA